MIHLYTSSCHSCDVASLLSLMLIHIGVITRNSWTRNLIFRGLPYTNLDHYIVASMENYALGFLHIAQPTLDKFRSSWHKVRYHHESGT